MMDFACWKCVEVEVRNPGEMCTRCFESDDRAQRKRASSERSTATHERTHEMYRVSLDSGAVDKESYRRWSR